jgi:hypothetical protein
MPPVSSWPNRAGIQSRSQQLKKRTEPLALFQRGQLLGVVIVVFFCVCRFLGSAFGDPKMERFGSLSEERKFIAL